MLTSRGAGGGPVGRFYFDFDDGEDQAIDSVGLNYVSPLLARQAALCALPDFSRDLLPDDDRIVTVTVRNESGAPIFAARLKLEARWIV